MEQMKTTGNKTVSIPATKFEIKDIIARRDDDGKNIKQVRMITVDGEAITHKPMVTVTTKLPKQIPVEDTTPATLEELPDKFKRIYAEFIGKGKTAHIETPYHRLDATTKDGTKSYMFLNDEDLELLEIQ